MKTRILPAAIAAAFTALLPAAASAQTAAPSDGVTSPPGGLHPSFYGTLGYADVGVEHVDLGTIQVRLGSRLTRFFGVEAEGVWGVNKSTHDVYGIRYPEGIASQEAIYAVAYLPVGPTIDLFARIGYGHTSGSGPKTVPLAHPDIVGWTGPSFSYDPGVRGDSWDYGVGGRYMFDPKNGVRVDYVREDYATSDTPDANVWSLSYVRKF